MPQHPEFARLLGLMNDRIANRRPTVIESGLAGDRSANFAGPSGQPAAAAAPTPTPTPGALFGAPPVPTGAGVGGAVPAEAANANPGADTPTKKGPKPNSPKAIKLGARLTKLEARKAMLTAKIPGLEAKRDSKIAARIGKREAKLGARETRLTAAGKTKKAAAVQTRLDAQPGRQATRTAAANAHIEHRVLGGVNRRIARTRGRMGYDPSSG